MSIDTRAIAWHHLFPAGSTFTTSSAPPALREAIGVLGSGDRNAVLVSWNERPAEMPDLDRYQGFVAINARDLDRRRLSDAGFTWIRQFAVLPSMNDPRWFIPIGPARASSAALALYRPLRTSSHVKHLGIRAAARTGFTPVFRHRVTIAQRTAPMLERELAAALGTSRFELSISTGTPGPARKPTIAVISPEGEALAFVKIASSPLSRRLAGNEVACLGALRLRSGMQGRVPEVLFAQELDASYVLAQHALPGAMPGTALTDGHRQLLHALGSDELVLAGETAYMHTLAGRIDGIADRFPELAATFRVARRAIADAPVRRTVVHGDFAPWNLRVSHGEVRAFDWEYGVLDGLPLIDELYHLWQPGLRLRQWSEEEAMGHLLAFRGSEEALQLDTRTLRGIQAIGLLHDLARKVTEGHSTTSRGFIRLANLSRRLAAMTEEE